MPKGTRQKKNVENSTLGSDNFGNFLKNFGKNPEGGPLEKLKKT